MLGFVLDTADIVKDDDFSPRLPGVRNQVSAGTGMSNSPERLQTAHFDFVGLIHPSGGDNSSASTGPHVPGIYS